MSESRRHSKRTFAVPAGRRKNLFARTPPLKIACALAAFAGLILGDSGLRQVIRGSSLGETGQRKVANIRPSVNLDLDTPAPVVQVQTRKDPDLSKALRKYDLLKLNRKAAVSQIHSNGRFVLKTSHGEFDLSLSPYDLRSKDYRSQLIGADGLAREVAPGPVHTYKGEIKGRDHAQARMTITENAIEGLIITGSDRYFIQPARSLSKTTHEDEFVFYDGQDVTGEVGSCGVTLAEQVAAETQRAKDYVTRQEPGIASANSIPPLSPPRVVRLATDADAEYVTALGGASQANNQILNIMNQVDGIYQVEIGLAFQVTFQNNWAHAGSDPYVSTDSLDILREFAEYWNANFTGTPRNLSHLWTGKQLVGAIGRAFLAVTCRFPNSSYAVSQRTPDNPANPITSVTVNLAAHEIGHNFGGVHPHEPPETPADIEVSCRSTIMNTTGGGSTFCAFSRSQIMSYVGVWGSCLADASSPPPSYPPCVEVPLDSSLSVNGELSTTDCRAPSRGPNYYADRYSFEGEAGQRLHLTLTPISAGLDSLLYLIAPDGLVIARLTNGNNPARLPFSGSFTLPQTGKYIIEATSITGQALGQYRISVVFDGCTLSVSPASQHFPAGGGSGTINVTATGSGCSSIYHFMTFPFSESWLKVLTNSGTGSQSLNFSVQPNVSAAGRRAFLVVGATFGDGLSIPITQSGTGPDCSLTPIAFGQTINGNRATSDCQSPINGGFADRYVFTASAAQEVAISASGSNMGIFLTLIGPDQRVILTDNGGYSLGRARLPGGTGMLTLALAGTYVVEVTGSGLGPYAITLTTNTPQPPPVLLTEVNTDVAIALSSVTNLRDPFPLTDPFNLSLDGQARVLLFATNLDLFPGENHSAVTAVAEDNHGIVYPLTVEFVSKVPSFDWLSQMVIKLPTNLPVGQDVRVSVTLHSQTSNKARLKIK